MDNNWTTVIRANTGWFDVNLKEVLRYKDLIFLFVKRNYTTRYKQTILGPLWLVITPLLTTLMQTIVFGQIAQLSTDGVPQFAFYMAGNIVWTFFAWCLNQTSKTFIDNAAVFGKVYFPRLVTPIATVLTGGMDFVIQYFIFLIVIVLFLIQGAGITVSWLVILTPFLILQIACLGLGFGIIVSSLTTKYRDLSVLVTFGVQLWMYASPVVYPLTQVPERFQTIYLLNPVSPIITIFRNIYLGSGEIPWGMWGVSWITTFIVLAIGIVIFSHVQKTFMDTV